MFNSLPQLVFVFVLLLVIVAVIKILRQKAQGAQSYPYEKEQALFFPGCTGTGR